MVMTNNKITKEGLENTKKEYEELVTKVRPAIAERIKEAKDFGDLSENAEYEAAREEQSQVERKILELEYILEHAEVIDLKSVSTKTVSIGVKVTLYDVEFDEEISYRIVGENEANPFEGLLSSSSPVGSALIGHKKGDVVKVTNPGGESEYKILKISK